MHVQEPEALQRLHTLPVYVDGLQISLLLPVVHNHLLSSRGVEDQVVVLTPTHQPLDPMSVGRIIVPGDKSH